MQPLFIALTVNICRYSSVVEFQLPKLAMRVRFPLPAPKSTSHGLSIFYEIH